MRRARQVGGCHSGAHGDDVVVGLARIEAADLLEDLLRDLRRPGRDLVRRGSIASHKYIRQIDFIILANFLLEVIEQPECRGRVQPRQGLGDADQVEIPGLALPGGARQRFCLGEQLVPALFLPGR